MGTCRVCLVTFGKTILMDLNQRSIYLKEDKPLSYIFEEVTRVEAHFNWPNKICGTCNENLLGAYNFIKQVTESEKKLKKDLKKFYIKATKALEKKESVPGAVFQTVENNDLEDSEKKLSENQTMTFMKSSDDIPTKKLKNNNEYNNGCNFTVYMLGSMSPNSDAQDELILDSIKQETVFHEEFHINFSENYFKDSSEMLQDKIKEEPIDDDITSDTEHHNDSEPMLNNCWSSTWEVPILEDIKPTKEELDKAMECLNKSFKPEKPEVEGNLTDSKKQLHSCTCGDPLRTENCNCKSGESPTLPKKCMLCNKSFKSEKTLKNHVITSHSYMESKCSWCGMVFADEKSLSLHLDTHFSTPFNAKSSSKHVKVKFDNQCQLQKHSKALYHSKTKIKIKSDPPGKVSIKCFNCNRLFTNKSAITRHSKFCRLKMNDFINKNQNLSHNCNLTVKSLLSLK